MASGCPAQEEFAQAYEQLRDAVMPQAAAG
jgi:hypothetical protein